MFVQNDLCNCLTEAVLKKFLPALKPLWAVVNLNLNRSGPVCTGLPDNSVY